MINKSNVVYTIFKGVCYSYYKFFLVFFHCFSKWRGISHVDCQFFGLFSFRLFSCCTQQLHDECCVEQAFRRLAFGAGGGERWEKQQEERDCYSWLALIAFKREQKIVLPTFVRSLRQAMSERWLAACRELIMLL